MPLVPGSPQPTSPSAGAATWLESSDGVAVMEHLTFIQTITEARIRELNIMWQSPSWQVVSEALEVDRPSNDDTSASRFRRPFWSMRRSKR